MTQNQVLIFLFPLKDSHRVWLNISQNPANRSSQSERHQGTWHLCHTLAEIVG